MIETYTMAFNLGMLVCAPLSDMFERTMGERDGVVSDAQFILQIFLSDKINDCVFKETF